MNLPSVKTRPSEEERKLAVLKAHEAREKIFKLVVKIIRWETEVSTSTTDKNVSKITTDEWHRYTKHLLGIYQPENQAKIKEKLKKTYDTIKGHGGFA